MRRPLVAVSFVAAFLSLAPTARADTVSMTFVANPHGIIGPYIGTVDGRIADIICDDYIAETVEDESWTANVSTFADDLSLTKFKDRTGYEEVAYLASNLLDSTDAGSARAIQFALWEVFAQPIPFNDLSDADRAAAQVWLDQAIAFVNNPGFNPALYGQFVIYTATGTPMCSGSPCIGGLEKTPQEFVTFVPEPGTLGLLAIGLLMALAYEWQRKSANGVRAQTVESI